RALAEVGRVRDRRAGARGLHAAGVARRIRAQRSPPDARADQDAGPDTTAAAELNFDVGVAVERAAADEVDLEGDHPQVDLGVVGGPDGAGALAALVDRAAVPVALVVVDPQRVRRPDVQVADCDVDVEGPRDAPGVAAVDVEVAAVDLGQAVLRAPV